MKTRLLLTTLLCGAALNICYAQGGFGVCNYGKQRVPSVICYGPAVLKQTVVAGNIKVVGPFTARNIIASSMTITGAADIADSEISGNVDITGFIKTQNSHFYKGMTIESDSAVLSNSVVTGDITMNSASTKPVIKLICKTSVAGSIIFGSMAGVVQVSDDSSLQGKIQNGSTEFIRVSC